MAQGEGKQKATAAGSISVPAIFLVHGVAQIASILIESVRAPSPEADSANLHPLASESHLETILRHVPHAGVRWASLGENEFDISIDQASWIIEFAL